MPAKKLLLPTLAALVLLAIMWFAFRDDTAEAPAMHGVASAVAVAASEPTPDLHPMTTSASRVGQGGESSPPREEADKASKP